MEFLKSEKSVRKILFTGLDNGGKTSIIHSLEREFANIAIINPTKGAQRKIFKFLDLEISEWDLGGQSKYRISYIRNPDKYFDNTEIAIFVVDIQDEQRFDENEDMIRLLKHKMKIKIKYKPINYYNTSIYRMDTIITAISKILLELYPKVELIDRTLMEFAMRINAEGLLLVDNNSLIIASYYNNEKTQNLIKKSLIYFLSLSDILKKSNLFKSSDKDYILVQKSDKFFHFSEVILNKNYPSYYILSIKGGQYFYKDDIKTFTKVMGEIIYS
ncbi:MAG: ADP-ribosylation factor-like protein [Candidatus Lokiarchaeota archaeon]